MPAIRRPMMPRPDNPELVKAFTDSITLGLPLPAAATRAGMGEQTARDWINQGSADLDAGEASPKAAFAWSVKQAEAAFMADKMTLAVEDIRAAPVGKRWMGAITVLERRYPEHYGKREHLDVTSTQLSINVTVPPEAVAALSRTLGNTKLLAAGSDDES